MSLPEKIQSFTSMSLPKRPESRQNIQWLLSYSPPEDIRGISTIVRIKKIKKNNIYTDLDDVQEEHERKRQDTLLRLKEEKIKEIKLIDDISNKLSEENSLKTAYEKSIELKEYIGMFKQKVDISKHMIKLNEIIINTYYYEIKIFFLSYPHLITLGPSFIYWWFMVRHNINQNLKLIKDNLFHKLDYIFNLTITSTVCESILLDTYKKKEIKDKEKDNQGFNEVKDNQGFKEVKDNQGFKEVKKKVPISLCPVKAPFTFICKYSTCKKWDCRGYHIGKDGTKMCPYQERCNIRCIGNCTKNNQCHPLTNRKTLCCKLFHTGDKILDNGEEIDEKEAIKRSEKSKPINREYQGICYKELCRDCLGWHKNTPECTKGVNCWRRCIGKCNLKNKCFEDTFCCKYSHPGDVVKYKNDNEIFIITPKAAYEIVLETERKISLEKHNKLIEKNRQQQIDAEKCKKEKALKLEESLQEKKKSSEKKARPVKVDLNQEDEFTKFELLFENKSYILNRIERNMLSKITSTVELSKKSRDLLSKFDKREIDCQMPDSDEEESSEPEDLTDLQNEFQNMKKKFYVNQFKILTFEEKGLILELQEKDLTLKEELSLLFSDNKKREIELRT